MNITSTYNTKAIKTKQNKQKKMKSKEKDATLLLPNIT